VGENEGEEDVGDLEGDNDGDEREGEKDGAFEGLDLVGLVVGA